MTVAPAPAGYVPLTFSLQWRDVDAVHNYDVSVDTWIPTGMEGVPSRKAISGNLFGEPVDATRHGAMNPAERTALTAFAQSLAGVDLLQHAVPHEPGAGLGPTEQRIVFTGPGEAPQGGQADLYAMPLDTFHEQFAVQAGLLEDYQRAAFPDDHAEPAAAAPA